MQTREFTEALPSLVALQARLASFRLSLVSRKLAWSLKYGFNPSQPRVPRGEPDGGQWTDDGVGIAAPARRPQVSVPRRARDGDRVAGSRGDSRVGDKPVRVAQSGRVPRGSGPRRVGGSNRLVEPTLAEEAELAATRLMLDIALQRVRAVDPGWRPTPSLTETVRGEIASNRAQADEAEARFFELQRNGIGPGPFAGEWIPARGSSRNSSRSETSAVNAIGRATGCHTCGTKESGLASGNFFKDHQLPTARGGLGKPQRLFPQCQSCSGRQGAWISNNRR